ncbi:MAG TPA: hypothetical protein VHW69_02340 [Rhizomicrobium sp.]|nr:hypothetical protein [Rhizomicrobium sp.]
MSAGRLVTSGRVVELTGRVVELTGDSGGGITRKTCGLPALPAVAGRVVELTGDSGGGITRKTCGLAALAAKGRGEDTALVGVALGPNGSSAGWKGADAIGPLAAVVAPPFAANAEGATPSAEAIAMHPNKRAVAFITASPVS